jgi:predicted nucleotidyltransferase
MDYKNYIQFKALTGSKAYGLNIETSDDDWRGFYIPPTHSFFSFVEPPEQLQTTKDEDYSYWELRKFLKLILANNPNVLETLWSPVMIYPNTHTGDLIKHFIETYRDSFISKRIINTYGGYATSQLKRGEEYVARGKTKDGWKHLMHLCRLLIQGTESLKTGTLQVNVGTYKERLLSIRHEQMSMEIFKIWHSELEEKFNEAKLVTKLPDEPDPKPAEDFLRQMRLLMLFPWEPDNDLLSS